MQHRTTPEAGGRAGGSPPPSADSLALRLLLIAGQEGDPDLLAVAGLLDVLGTPYDVVLAGRRRLTAKQLAGNAHAHYQGIIMVAGSAGLLSRAEWQTLCSYQTRFAVRLVIINCPAGEPHCPFGLDLEPVEGGSAPLQLTLTEVGREVFWYLNQEAPLTLSNAPLHLARQPADGATPLLLAADGRAAALLRDSGDGCQALLLTLGLAPGTRPAQLLGYGLVNWVCRGLFLGLRQVYLSLHIDDVFAGAELWDPARQATSGERLYRVDGRDVEALLGWRRRVRAQVVNAAGLDLDLAFNGGGLLGAAEDDTLAACLAKHQTSFRWINHGYSHQDCEKIGYQDSLQEILRNNEAAHSLGLRRYTPDSLVTPQVSGLGNAEFLRAAAQAGVRYLVSDTSRPAGRNPAPNTGIACAHQPGISIIPRHPTNLYANVSTPEEWVSEYNHFYHGLWRRDLGLEEILDLEAETILGYLLTFDLDPLMFHQANLRSYKGRRSLLSDLIDRVLAKYNAVYGQVPIRSLSMHEVGEAMCRRALYGAARVEARLIRGLGLVLFADREVSVPVTGVSLGGESETYAGQAQSWLNVAAARPRIVALANVVGGP